MRSKSLPAMGLWAAWCAAVVALAAFSGGFQPVAAQPGRSAMRTMGIVETGPGRVSVDVQGAEIRTLLRAFSEFSGRNIVVGKEVKGTVSVAVRDMPWRDALVTILRSNGLDLAEENGAIRVDLSETLQAEILARETNEARLLEVRPLETRLVPLNYSNAKELQNVVQSVLSRRGQIQVDERTNTLVVTDVPEAVAQAEKMAADLDKETPQIEIISKLVDVDVSSLRELGVNWTGTNLNIGNTADTFEEFDVFAGISDPVLSFRIGTFTNPGDLQLELQALELKRKANIISNPRITTVDNREAKILVGQKIPLIVQDVAGNAVSQLTQIGIQLRVTPHLTADRRIVLDIHPEVSDLASQSTVQGGIIINTSEADTRVMVDDGQTAVIGGLLRDNSGTIKTGVPFLMDIPLIGYLFSSTSTVDQQRELVIFVTPTIVRAE